MELNLTSYDYRCTSLQTTLFINRSCNPLSLFHLTITCDNAHLPEISGSLGDLGTFIPLTVALARERKIALAPALFWAGISNFVTGYIWGEYFESI